MIILNKEYREIYSREVTREIPNSETESFSRKIVYRYRQNDDRLDNIKSFIFIEGSI